MHLPLRDWSLAAAGHAWTVLPELRQRVRPVSAPPTEQWHVDLVDPQMGSVRLLGRYHRVPGARTVLLIVHGLGGTPTSPYCLRAACEAARRGWSSLRIGMRGCTGDGEDLYHAGLGSDLGAVLNDPSLAGYERVLVLGYSLGGHLSLVHALEPAPRVQAVAAVSSPLNLELSCQAIDLRRGFVYRHHVLNALKACYAVTANRRSLPTPADQVHRVRTIREWDRVAVVPRFGFDDVADYYQQASVGPRLRDVQCPSLYLGMRHDPMIPPWVVEPSLATSSGGRFEYRWLDNGGHVFAPGSWETDTIDWLDRQRR